MKSMSTDHRSSLRRVMEILANCSTIALAVLALVVAVWRISGNTSRIQPPPVSSTPGYEPATVGAAVSLAGIDWARNESTLLLVLSTGCHFCSDNAPFYRRLTSRARSRGHVKLVGVFAQAPDEANVYLRGLGVELDTVLQEGPSTLGVSGTPTLLMIDARGVVRHVWVGSLDEPRQQQVLDLF